MAHGAFSTNLYTTVVGWPSACHMRLLGPILLTRFSCRKPSHEDRAALHHHPNWRQSGRPRRAQWLSWDRRMVETAERLDSRSLLLRKMCARSYLPTRRFLDLHHSPQSSEVESDHRPLLYQSNDLTPDLPEDCATKMVGSPGCLTPDPRWIPSTHADKRDTCGRISPSTLHYDPKSTWLGSNQRVPTTVSTPYKSEPIHVDCAHLKRQRARPETHPFPYPPTET